MKLLKIMYLKQKRRKLINGLAWLMESDPDNTNIITMTNQLQQVNEEISKLKDE